MAAGKKKKELTERQYYDRRKSALELERSSFIAHWKELSDFILPRRGRFFVEDRNRGDKRYQSIVNSTATQAAKTARAGLLSGVMSPSRIWFNLATEDKSLMEVQEVKEWLQDVRNLMNDKFNQSNLFNVAPVMLSELVLFGTGLLLQLEDDKDVFRFYSPTVGSYTIGVDERGEVNTIIREYQQTVDQLVDEFGYDNCSVIVQNAYDKNDCDSWHTVVNYIGPNARSDDSRAEPEYKKTVSVYYEKGNVDKEAFLRKTGFNDFPGFGTRWDLTGEDIYGTDCPGMVALGDVKQLQIEERRKAQAVDKLVNPPLKGPASLRNVPVNSLPGGLTVYDSDGNKEGLGPIYQVDPRLQEMNEGIAKIEKRIKDVFFVDLFFAITQMEGIQPRNELELTQRNQERLLQLGPVLERLHSEFLNKLIERSFNMLARRGMIPPVPQALAGQPLKVNYVSSLAMAQRSAEVEAIEDVRTFISELAQSGFPEAIDKLDADVAVDELALIRGVPANIIRGADQVQKIRDTRLQHQQQDAQAAQAQKLTEQFVNVNRTNQ